MATVSNDRSVQENSDQTLKINQAIGRLRASRERCNKEAQEQGAADGRKWAADTAEADELDRVADLHETSGNDWGSFFDDSGNAYSSAERLFFVIQPEHNGDRGQASEFWAFVLGEGRTRYTGNADYVQAFAEGALELWDEVSANL